MRYMSVVMEDLALELPYLPGMSDGNHCISVARQAQLQVRGCVFSSPHSPCIGINDRGTCCRLVDCSFGPDKERTASAAIIVDDSSDVVADRCRFLRCSKAAVEVRSAGSRAHLRECKFIKCKQQAVVLYNGGEGLVMEDCLIKRCGDSTIHSLAQVGCGTAHLLRCSFVDNRSDAVMVQCDVGQKAPVLVMRECTLKGNLSGVMFGLGEGESSGGSGILANNQIVDNAGAGVTICAVAPNLEVQLLDNVCHGNGPNIGQGRSDIFLFQDVQDQVVVRRHCGTISVAPASASDACRIELGDLRT
eukprot:gene18401-24872_t